LKSPALTSSLRNRKRQEVVRASPSAVSDLFRITADEKIADDARARHAG
jgi:hypothetical protein